MSVYSTDEILTPTLSSAMRTCFISFAGVGIGLETSAGLSLGLGYNTAEKLTIYKRMLLHCHCSRPGSILRVCLR